MDTTPEPSGNPLQTVLDLLRRLDEAKTWFRLERVRDEAIMVQVAVPGERWEIEVFSDGEIEVEVFKSGGEIRGEAAVEELFRRFGD